VECILLNTTIPLFLRYRILKDGVVLFCKDEEIRTDLIETTVNYALDFKPLREAAIYLLKVYFVLIKRRIKYGRK
jgi:hypothetical protein